MSVTSIEDLELLEELWNMDVVKCQLPLCENPAVVKVTWAECKCGKNTVMYCKPCMLGYRKFSVRRGFYYQGGCFICNTLLEPLSILPI